MDDRYTTLIPSCLVLQCDNQQPFISERSAMQPIQTNMHFSSVVQGTYRGGSELLTRWHFMRRMDSKEKGNLDQCQKV